MKWPARWYFQLPLWLNYITRTNNKLYVHSNISNEACMYSSDTNIAYMRPSNWSMLASLCALWCNQIKICSTFIKDLWVILQNWCVGFVISFGWTAFAVDSLTFPLLYLHFSYEWVIEWFSTTNEGLILSRDSVKRRFAANIRFELTILISKSTVATHNSIWLFDSLTIYSLNLTMSCQKNREKLTLCWDECVVAKTIRAVRWFLFDFIFDGFWCEWTHFYSNTIWFIAFRGGEQS